MSQRDNSIINFVRGIFIVFGSHVLILIPLLLLAWIGGVTKIDFLAVPVVAHLFAVGLTQLVYVIPIGIDYQRRREYDVVKGIIVGAVITALLNGGCWYLVRTYPNKFISTQTTQLSIIARSILV